LNDTLDNDFRSRFHILSLEQSPGHLTGVYIVVRGLGIKD